MEQGTPAMAGFKQLEQFVLHCKKKNFNGVVFGKKKTSHIIKYSGNQKTVELFFLSFYHEPRSGFCKPKLRIAINYS